MADKDVNKTPRETDPAESSIAVKRSGKQVAKLQQRIKVTKWVLFSLLLLVIILYLLFIFFWRGGLDGEGGGTGDEYGDFTVKIDDTSQEHITLSETIGFEEPTIILPGTSVHDMWHCTREWIPADIQDQSNGGEHNSDDPSYLAYTFYLKNFSDGRIKYTYNFELTDRVINSQLDALDALRVMFIRNGEKIVWANPSKDGTPIEANTSIFSAEPYLMELQDNSMEPGAIDKYTVVMWLEGEDPECINDIFYNMLKFQMNFNVQKSIVENTTE